MINSKIIILFKKIKQIFNYRKLIKIYKLMTRNSFYIFEGACCYLKSYNTFKNKFK